MEQLRRDLAFAVRMLLKHPGLSLIVILTLSLGIGLTTTVFCWVNGALFKGLPFPEGERVVVLGSTAPSRNVQFSGVSVPDFVDWRGQQMTHQELGALTFRTINLAGTEGRPERFAGAYVTANMFDLLRVQPVLGRAFREGEDLPGAEPVIVIGYEVWQDRFDGSPDVIGKTVRANGLTMTIIGVAPEGFAFPDRERLWTPLSLDPSASARAERPLTVIGRLRDGVSMDEAKAELATIARRLEREYPESNEGVGATVRSFTEMLIGGQVFALVYTMLGAVIGVLLVACFNVGNLLLARASVRTREVAVRTALGASRGRVVSQLMTEVLLLSAIGGAFGFFLGHQGVIWYERFVGGEPPPFWVTFEPDLRVVLFVVAITVLAAVVSGLVPALRATGGNVSETLKDEARGTSSFRLGKLSAGLIIAEVTLSCALLIVAGLMIKSVTQIRTKDLPFATDNIFTARLQLPAPEYPDTASRLQFYAELLPRLAAVPGAQAATLSDGLPASGNGPRVFEVEGVAYAIDEDFPTAREGIVTPGYFETFQTPVLQGRAFSVADREGTLPVAIVNESFVRSFFSEGDPLGRRIRMGRRDTSAKWLTVVGVVPDMLMEGIANLEGRPAGFYIPVAQSGVGTRVNIAIRTGGAPLAITPAVRATVESLDRNLPIYDVMSMNGVIARETWVHWTFSTIFMVMGVVGLMLATVGLYGVMSFTVSRRSQEMGIRMALGADTPRLVRLVMKRGAVQLAIGIVLGIGIAALAITPVQFMLYEVDPRDPAVFGLVAIALALAGTLASFIPARRVTRLDPVIALTSE